MKKIKLMFPSIHYLWEFRQTLKTSNVEVNVKDKSLVCDLSGADISMAVTKYRAKCIETVEKTTLHQHGS